MQHMQAAKRNELAAVVSLFVFSMLISSAVFVMAQDVTTSSSSSSTTTTTTTPSVRRGLVVKPAQLGTYRVTIPLFSDYVANQSFMIGNAYEVPLNASLKMNG